LTIHRFLVHLDSHSDFSRILQQIQNMSTRPFQVIKAEPTLSDAWENTNMNDFVPVIVLPALGLPFTLKHGTPLIRAQSCASLLARHTPQTVVAPINARPAAIAMTTFAGVTGGLIYALTQSSSKFHVVVFPLGVTYQVIPHYLRSLVTI
jgi:hypothetical protein